MKPSHTIWENHPSPWIIWLSSDEKPETVYYWNFACLISSIQFLWQSIGLLSCRLHDITKEKERPGQANPIQENKYIQHWICIYSWTFGGRRRDQWFNLMKCNWFLREKYIKTNSYEWMFFAACTSRTSLCKYFACNSLSFFWIAAFCIEIICSSFR